MTAPRAPRRPYRTVGISPSTAWLWAQARRAMPDLDDFMKAMARRHLDVEEQLRHIDDDEDVDRAASEWQAWRAFGQRFDVEPANPTRSNLPASSEHDDEIPGPQAAKELGVSPQYVGRLVRDGHLVGRKVNARSLMVSQASVEAFKARRAG